MMNEKHLSRLQNLEHRQSVTDDLVSNLRERIKELDCLYAISHIVNSPGISLDDLIREVAKIIPSSMQYPERTSARLLINGAEYRSDPFVETEKLITRPVQMFGKPTGRIEVFLAPPPDDPDADFPHEEQRLLSAVAERMGKILERYHATELIRTLPAAEILDDSDGFPTFFDAREKLESLYLTRLLDHVRYNKAEAARISGLSRGYLYKLLKKHGLLTD